MLCMLCLVAAVTAFAEEAEVFFAGGKGDQICEGAVALDDGRVLILGSVEGEGEAKPASDGSEAWAVCLSADGKLEWELKYKTHEIRNRFEDALLLADGTFLLEYVYFTGEATLHELVWVDAEGNMLEAGVLPKEALVFPMQDGFVLLRYDQADGHERLEKVDTKGVRQWDKPSGIENSLVMDAIAMGDGLLFIGSSTVEEDYDERGMLAWMTADGEIAWQAETKLDGDCVFRSAYKLEDGFLAVGFRYRETDGPELNIINGVMARFDENGAELWVKEVPYEGGGLEFEDIEQAEKGFFVLGNTEYVTPTIVLTYINEGGDTLQRWEYPADEDVEYYYAPKLLHAGENMYVVSTVRAVGGDGFDVVAYRVDVP